MNQNLYNLSYKMENNRFLIIVRRGLTMMIPLVLVGGIACALVNLPFVDYSSQFVQQYFGNIINILQYVGGE